VPKTVVALLVVPLVLLARAAVASNDPDFPRQYGPQQINAPSAWTKTRGTGVTIAVIDSGVDVDHAELKPKLVGGYDFGDNDGNPDDDAEVRDGAGKAVKGHGTAAAGVAAAATDNGVGIAGVAPDARIMPVKVFGRGGIAGITNVPQAISFAVNNGAKVLNLSIGTFNTGIDFVGLIDTPCADALQRGALCVVASGNGGGDRPSGYSRGFPGLVVTANDKEGRHAPFAQKADTRWALSAPGVAVYTTSTLEQGAYGTVNGTSFSAPHAAGVAALVYSLLRPPATASGVQAVVERMLSSAAPMGDPGASGAGRVDAAGSVGAAVQAAAPTTVAAPRTAPAPARRAGPSQTPAPDRPPAGAPAPGAEGAPASPGPSPDPTAPQTKGIRLATGSDRAADSSPEGTKPTLYTIAAALVLGTGWWSASNYARQVRGRKLKPFVTNRP
jgi:subtilisin family serine protease